MVIVQGFLVHKVVKSLGEHHVVPVSLALVSVGLLMIPAARSVAALLVASAIMAVGMGFNSPTLMSLISRYSSAEDQGGVMGLTQSLNSLARIAGPIWGGFAFDRLGMGVPYISAAVVMGIAGAISIHALWKARLAAGA
jgi:MFS family permease